MVQHPMSVNEPILRSLPEELRDVLRPYVKEVAKVFDENLTALLLYGSAAGGEYLAGRSNLNVLIVLKHMDQEALRTYAATHRRWQNDPVVAPVILTTAELRTAFERFPLEYLEIKDQSLVLYGRDPLVGLDVDVRRLPDQCLSELRGHVIRLRQRFVEGGGTVEAVLMLMPLSLTGLLPALRGLCRAMDRPVRRASEAVLRDIGEILGVEIEALEQALQLKRGQIEPGPSEAPRLFDRYCEAVSTLVEKAEQVLNVARDV